jgi:Amt family ammonium transporter
MLMTPGLAFFYGGLVGRKNVLAIMMQSYASMAVTTIVWWAFGYSLCFSGDFHGITGNLDAAFLRGIDLHTAYPGTAKIPLFVFVAYQMMFAIITPALITGAFANRIRFRAYVVFLVMWLVFVSSCSSTDLGRRLLRNGARSKFRGRHRRAATEWPRSRRSSVV